MSDVNFWINKLFNIFLVIAKTQSMDKLKKADITSARLLIESEQLAQAIEFPKQLKACAESWARHIEHTQLL